MIHHPAKPILKHLLDFETLDAEGILYLLEQTTHFSSLLLNKTPVQTRNNKTIASLFYEPSTRSQYSFVIAAQKLGIHCLSPNMMALSDKKGESLIDTVRSLEAMDVDLFILRHNANHTPHFIAGELNTSCSVINAGDGTNQHPTQTLIDLFTIQQAVGRLSDLNVTIIGDIQHSRVAHSFVDAANILQMGQINLVGPADFLPQRMELNIPVSLHTDLESGLSQADVVIALRIQTERIPPQDHPQQNDYFKQYGLTLDKMRFAKKNAIILHPGPTIRGTEIDSAVIDSPHSCIQQQVKNSIPTRMAVLELLLSQ